MSGSMTKGVPVSKTVMPRKVWAAGDRVEAKWKAESRAWKSAVVLRVETATVVVRFAGYSDEAAIPVDRVRLARPTKGSGRQRSTAQPLQPLRNPNAWQPSSKTDGSDDFTGQVKSLMSKLAPANFEVIATKLLALELDTPEKLQVAVAQMFERACAETGFCQLYAAVFARCAEGFPTFVNGDGRSVTFKRLLLNRAQDEFESVDTTTDRRRTLGFFVFLGALYEKNLLQEKVVLQCVRTLLGAAGGREDGALHADAVEAAATLLRTVGKTLDAKSTTALDSSFATLEQWARDKAKLPDTRMRFKLMDLLDERRAGWAKK